MAMERRRWVPEILRKGTSSASWLAGCGIEEREECMMEVTKPEELDGWWHQSLKWSMPQRLLGQGEPDAAVF